MEDLRVPKRKVRVQVVLPGGASRLVWLFLSDNAAGHEGPERVSDLLNGRDRFIPAEEAAGGGMTFLQRASIALARVSRDAEPGTIAHTIPIEHDVEITLTDGTCLHGTLSYLGRPPNDRVVDFLNEPEPFLLLQERDGVALVSRSHVARVALVAR